MELEAARTRQHRAYQRDVSLAWHVEALHRQKTLRPLAELLAPQGNRQSAAQQKAVLTVLSEQYGLPMRKGKAKT